MKRQVIEMTIFWQKAGALTFLFIIACLAIVSLDTTAAKADSIETKEGNVILRRQTIIQGPIPYLGQWGPLNRSFLTQLTVPRVFDGRTFRFVKPGRSSAECDDPDAYVELTSGQSTTPQQMKEIFGSEKVERVTGILLCIAGVGPFGNVVVVDTKYEKVVRDDEPDDEPAPTPPPIKTNKLRAINPFLSIRTVTCQQRDSNGGCTFSPGTSGYCPTGFELTRARATCNLEKSGLLDLPSNWNIVQVGRASDRPRDGRCTFGGAIQTGSRSITSMRRLISGRPISCREKDNQSGGDCSINAEFSCEKAVTQTLSFECSKEGSNRGCNRTISCPTGFRPSSARASCNLETTATPALSEWDKLTIVRATDTRPRDALCQVGRSSTINNDALTTKHIILPTGGPVRYACKEHDRNGGDCKIVGELQCTKVLDGLTESPPATTVP